MGERLFPSMEPPEVKNRIFKKPGAKLPNSSRSVNFGNGRRQ
jgi:hypothetical protein